MVVVVPLDCLSFQHCLRNRTTHLPLSSRFTTTTTTSLCFHSPIIQAKLPFFTNSDSFQVGRPIGTYGFINVTSYSAFPSGPGTDYSLEDLGGLKTQDVGEGNVKIRLYEGRVSRGPLTGTPVTFKVYPGRRAGGVVADALAANELNTHLFLQSSSKGIGQNLVLLVGGFETTTGEQWLAFRDDGKYNAADYAKLASERVSRDREGSSWNPFEQGLTTKRRQNFIIKMLQGVMKGLAYLHDHDRLHQSLGPFSVVLNTISEREGSYLIPRLRDLAFSVNVRYTELDDSGQLVEGLWRRATGAGAFTQMEKRAFGIADDIYEAGLFFAYMAFVPFCEAGVMDSLSLQRLLENTFQLDLEATREYCLADDRLVNAVEFLDLGDGAGWELLQAMLNADFRKRPTAEAVLNHRFMTGAVL
ncbi:hypothetical protein AAZX31_11G009700 [Glycine max]|uniref:Protein kinase domain-containing protein n=1 Tax=Glycine soja TaxID=3848 RepID=A0A445HVB7_GLYSO|nr:uncharacterized protein LOC114375012 isoform X1 [Glycine soja]KAG4972797.1 hypothetical protein JHK87_029618 [Glycine soja]RZB77717.1 hypothetical protein D0Y65_028628 [Glycine soja]